MGTHRQDSRGQAALIALLVMTIATTIGLSLLSRSTTDVSVTNRLEESARAFSAAEAGMEETLKTGSVSAGLLDTALDVSYDVKISSISGSTDTYSFPKATPDLETDTLWLVNHTDTGGIDDAVPFYTAPQLDVCWSAESATPAVVVTALFKQVSTGSYQVVKGAYDPDAARAAARNFTLPTTVADGCGPGTGTAYKQTVVFSALSGGVFATYQENDSKFVYTGVWTTAASGAGGQYKYTVDPTGTATFTFDGRGVTLYRTMASTYGTMEVCVDGVCATVDNYSATLKWGQPYTAASGLAQGTHVMVLRNLSNKRMSVDWAVTDSGPGPIASNDTMIALRLRPVYGGTHFVIKPAQALPFQGTRIESVGKTGSGVTRKIVVFQNYRSPGTVFDHAVYSEGSFAH